MGCQPSVPRAGSPRHIFVHRAASPGYRNVPRAASPRYKNVLGLPALGSKGLQIMVWSVQLRKTVQNVQFVHKNSVQLCTTVQNV